MPNVAIVGYDSDKTVELYRRICICLTEAGLHHEGVVTELENTRVTKADGSGKKMPHLIIRSTSWDEIQNIVVAFKKNGIHEDVELELLQGFISKEQMASPMPLPV